MILKTKKERLMKTLLKVCGVTLVVVLVGVVAFAGDTKSGATTAKPAALVTKTPDELKWVANPANAAVSMAVLWGDPAKGPHGAFHKFKAGFDAGLHTHSSDMRVVVVSGTLIAAAEGGPERKLTSGSYEFQPHGVKHVTKCDPASECVIFVVSSGKFDLIPADAKK
jgi:anti-sigma factor ChrR (cupin superfamily)